jgi:ArsR family metal-binding transcriptional regulator
MTNKTKHMKKTKVPIEAINTIKEQIQFHKQMIKNLLKAKEELADIEERINYSTKKVAELQEWVDQVSGEQGN